MSKPIVNDKIIYQNIYGRVNKHEGFLNQGVRKGDSPTFANIQLTGSATIEGNLYVEGNTTIVNSNVIEFEDNILLINRAETGSGVTLNQSGLEIERGIYENYRIIYSELDKTSRIGEISNLQAIATRQDAPLSHGIMTWNEIDKRLDATNTIQNDTTLSSTTNSTSSSSGSLVIKGGLGVSKDVFMDGRLYLKGSTGESSLWTDPLNTMNITSSNDINMSPTRNVKIPFDKALVFGNESQYINANGITNNLSIQAGGHINFSLSAGKRITIPNQIPITFSTENERVVADDSNNLIIASSQDVYINPGLNKKVMVPVDTPISFGNIYQKISSNLNNDLTISANNNINIIPGTNLNIKLPSDNGILFGNTGAQRIYANNLNQLFITSTSDLKLSSQTNITIPVDTPLTFGNNYEQYIKSDTYGNLLASAGQSVKILATKQSTSIEDGAFTVSGGVGISKNAHVGGDLFVNGNVTVAGTTSYLNTETLLVKDNLFVVNSESINGIDGGMLVKRSVMSATNGNTYASVFYKESNDELTFAYTASDSGTTLDITGYIPVRCDYLRITNSDDSTNFSNGSFSTLGGAYIKKNLRVDQDITASSLYINNDATFTNITSTNITTTSLGSLNMSSTNITCNSIKSTNIQSSAITTGTLNATSTVILNADVTNMTGSALILSEGITTANAQIINAKVTSLTSASLNSVDIITSSVYASFGECVSLTSANSNITSAIINNATIGSQYVTNGVFQNVSSVALTSPLCSLGNLFTTTSGNVGIKNKNPSQILEVTSILNTTSQDNGIRVSTEGLLNDDSYKYVNLNLKSTAQNVFRFGIDVLNGSSTGALNESISIPLASGYVGISTTSPSYTLDVNGSLGVSGTLTTNKRGGDAIVMTFNTDRPWSLKQKDSGTSASLVLQPHNPGQEYIIQDFSNNNVFVASSSSVTMPNTIVTNSLVTNQTVTNSLCSSITADSLLVSHNISVIGASNTLGSLFTTNGNVGIKTSNPTEVLDVYGNMHVGQQGTQSNYISFYGIHGDTYVGERSTGATQSELLVFKESTVRALAREIVFDTYNLTGHTTRTFDQVATNGTTRMTINSSGNVVVAQNMTIQGDIDVKGKLMGGVTSPSLIFSSVQGCSIIDYSSAKLLKISDEVLLSFAVSVTPSASSNLCTFQVEMPERTSNFTNRTDLLASCNGYTDDVAVIPLFNVLCVAQRDTNKGFIQFQSVSTGIHYFTVLCRYTSA